MTLGGSFSNPARATRPPRRRDAGAALRARLAPPLRIRDVDREQLAPHFDHGCEFGGRRPVAEHRGRAAVVSVHLPPPATPRVATYHEPTQCICSRICLGVCKDARLGGWTGILRFLARGGSD